MAIAPHISAWADAGCQGLTELHPNSKTPAKNSKSIRCSRSRGSAAKHNRESAFDREHHSKIKGFQRHTYCWQHAVRKEFISERRDHIRQANRLSSTIWHCTIDISSYHIYSTSFGPPRKTHMNGVSTARVLMHWIKAAVPSHQWMRRINDNQLTRQFCNPMASNKSANRFSIVCSRSVRS